MPEFSGPLTAVVITNWLEECESIFTEQDSEIRKILLAGSALSEPSLAKWWRAERSKFHDPETSWDDFIECLKTRALGRRWRTQALKTFYSIQQDQTDVDDYLAVMADACRVLNHGDEVIDDDQFKSLLLFRASASLSQQILSERGFHLDEASSEDIRTLLRDYEGENSPPPGSRYVVPAKFGIVQSNRPNCRDETKGNCSNETVNESETTTPESERTGEPDEECPVPEAEEEAAAEIKKLLGEIWLLSVPHGVCNDIGHHRFCDALERGFPSNPKDLGPITEIHVSHQMGWLAGYKFNFDGGYKVFDRFPFVRGGSNIERSALLLYKDEYPNSLTTVISPHSGELIGMKIGTSKGRLWGWGEDNPEYETITTASPKGYRIVGFHGAESNYNGGNWGVTGLGAIHAPL